MNHPTYYFNLTDAVNYLKNCFNTSLDLNGLDEYVPQSVFQYGLDPVQFEAMKLNLVWFTENDVLLAGCKIPNIYVVNPRTPETSSLVRIVAGNDTHVQYSHLCDPEQEVFKTTNRQFVLNSIKV